MKAYLSENIVEIHSCDNHLDSYVVEKRFPWFGVGRAGS